MTEIIKKEKPLLKGKNEKGQFVKGHSLSGGGVSFNKFRQKMIQGFMKCSSQADMEKIVKTMIKKAKQGDNFCIKELLDRWLGKDSININLDNNQIVFSINTMPYVDQVAQEPRGDTLLQDETNEPQVIESVAHKPIEKVIDVVPIESPIDTNVAYKATNEDKE